MMSKYNKIDGERSMTPESESIVARNRNSHRKRNYPEIKSCEYYEEKNINPC